MSTCNKEAFRYLSRIISIFILEISRCLFGEICILVSTLHFRKPFAHQETYVHIRDLKYILINIFIEHFNDLCDSALEWLLGVRWTDTVS